MSSHKDWLIFTSIFRKCITGIFSWIPSWNFTTKHLLSRVNSNANLIKKSNKSEKEPIPRLRIGNMIPETENLLRAIKIIQWNENDITESSLGKNVKKWITIFGIKQQTKLWCKLPKNQIQFCIYNRMNFIELSLLNWQHFCLNLNFLTFWYFGIIIWRKRLVPHSF